MYTNKATKKIDPVRKVPARYFDFYNDPSENSPEEIAATSIKEIANELQIAPDLTQLKFDKIKESNLGYHVLYQQQLNNKPISGSWIRVDLDKSKRVFNITNDLMPEWMIKQCADPLNIPLVAIEEARRLATIAISDAAGADPVFFDEELVSFPVNYVPATAWKIIFKVGKPVKGYKVYIDATTSEILCKVNMLKHAGGTIFNPRVIVRVLEVPPTISSDIPDDDYLNVTLEGLEDAGMLDGIFVSTRLTENRVSQPGSDFFFKRTDNGFREVMVYYYIDRVQRYVQELGFTNIMNKQIVVKVNGMEDDNSFFDSIDKLIILGRGGVNDAEDPEIIVHEYGHALMEDILPGFGENNQEAKAMEEGFCDYLAASFFEEHKPDLLKPTFGSWNALGLNTTNHPPCVRRLDSSKRFRNDMTGNAHNDCEIWSACLWEIRERLKRRKADQLIITHLRLLTKKSIFESAAELMILTDKELNKGENEAFIRDVFIRREILV